MRTILKQSTIILCGLLISFMSVSAPAADNLEVESVYRLSVGDKLRVTVYGHEDLSGEFEIDATGSISLPLIGDIEATGETADELEVVVTDALRPDYLKNPRVSVELIDFRPFYIFGEVKSPGSYPYSNGMTVISAVAVAGGFTYRARKSRIHILRGAADNQVRIKVEDDTLIRPGDVIEIPERFF